MKDLFKLLIVIYALGAFILCGAECPDYWNFSKVILFHLFTVVNFFGACLLCNKLFR